MNPYQVIWLNAVPTIFCMCVGVCFDLLVVMMPLREETT